MNELEKLEQEAYDNKVRIHNYYLGAGNLKGLYIDGNIALSNDLENSVQKSCVLAEELGHHYTSVGNILDQSNIYNRKQEHQARLWAYNAKVGLSGIIRAYENNCQNASEIAEFLAVTEQFLVEAIDAYRGKYGIYVNVDNYLIYFEPCLTVIKLI